MKSLHLTPIVALLLAITVPAQLTPGTYTIDPSLPAGGGNYQTWAAASAALASGVTGSGNLVFLVASTTFAETVNFATIPGTSATTAILFIAQGAPAIIDAGGLQDAFTLNNAQAYLTFENITIRNFTRYGLNLFGTSTLRCSFCNFRRITVDGPQSTSASVFALRAYYGVDCLFENCVIKGGGYVMRSEQIVRNKFRRCEFDGKGSAQKVLAPFNNNDADNLWENCFIHDCGAAGVGISNDLSSYGNMYWHNAVIVTTSARAVMLRSLTGWGRANSFRNNVVVNFGTGVGMTYGSAAGVGTPAAPGLLQTNDLDYNVYWVPNGNAVEQQSGVAPNFTRGSLAAWRTFVAANPAIIPAGGGSSWDNNSIEINPGLVSLTAPYDIHLAPGSPCKDAGTTIYVAGIWMTYPAGSFVADDFESDPRPLAAVDIGADETVVCAPPVYETNSPGSNLDIDFVQGSTCLPAITLKAQGSPATLHLASTNVGLGWEAALAIAPLLPAGGGAIATANGQLLGIDFTAPILTFLNGGGVPSFANPFPGNFSVGFTAPFNTLTASIQMVNIDPANPDFISISQGCQLNVP